MSAHPSSCDCYTCKLRSLTFDTGKAKTHVKRGSHWDGNPVAERIKELSGVEVNTDIPSLSKEQV